MDGKQAIESIRLENVLSYGPDTPAFQLGPLNVLIGPNGSGKSNLIEALSILKAAPIDIQVPFREGGGVREWIWKGPAKTPMSTLEITVPFFGSAKQFRYRLSFDELIGRFTILEELLEDDSLSNPNREESHYYHRQMGRSVISLSDRNSRQRRLTEDNDIVSDQSILSQRVNSLSFPELTYIASQFQQIYFYREFPLGRNAPARWPQQADLPQHALAEDASNIAVMLNYLQNDPNARMYIQNQMEEFYPSVRHIHSRLLGGTVQLFFEEEGLNANVPATRLSDGCLQYLCLLVALINPHIPSVICIEEPETGLHPDAIPRLAELLVTASKRSQIVVTTHSDILVDALTDTPEAVVICEKVDGATQLRRLDADKLRVWLDKYRLGELWTRGQLGGNLW